MVCNLRKVLTDALDYGTWRMRLWSVINDMYSYSLPYSSFSLFLWFAVPFLAIIIIVILLIVAILLLQKILGKILFSKFLSPTIDTDLKTKKSPSFHESPTFTVDILSKKTTESSSGKQEPVPSSIKIEDDSYFWDTGKTGERYIQETFKFLSGYKRFLGNCYVPKDDGTFTEIDIILLHVSGIYVIESKNYSGWIFGNENDKHWVQSFPTKGGHTKKIRFFSPIIQNKVHLRWLRKYLDIETDFPIYSYIVFSDRCELKKIGLTSTEHVVINRRALSSHIRRNFEKSGCKLSVTEIDSLYTRLYPLTQITEEQKALHIKNIEQKKCAAKSSVSSETRKCPRCGGDLVTRTVKKGERVGKHILGCSNYPKCRYIENIDSSPE